jgi:hydroxymethylpyrimidine pyrophosphatase-like HAD family hydrolase
VDVPEIDLVVTDLDGTLWDVDGHIHERTIGAIGAIQAAGIIVLAATARRAASTWQLMEANGIALDAVVLDGALGREFGDRSGFHRAGFGPDEAAATLEVLRVLGIEPCINLDRVDRDVVMGERPSTHPAHREWLSPWVLDAEPAEAVRTLPVLSFSLAGGDAERTRFVASEVARRLPVAATANKDEQYGGCGLSVRPLGVDKWTGVEAYCAFRGFDPARVLAVGDGANDAELLAGASVACSIAGGAPATVALADHVLARPAEGGWAAIADLLSVSSAPGSGWWSNGR